MDFKSLAKCCKSGKCTSKRNLHHELAVSTLIGFFTYKTEKKKAKAGCIIISSQKTKTTKKRGEKEAINSK